MKRVLTILPLTALCISTMQAQHKNEYTNFADTTFNIQDAVRFMPGVRFQTSYGAFQQLSIRGFDHSIMMIDGIRDERSAINNSYPVPDLSCIESIELLKGPASVLYGHSAVGGTLNIVRKSPSEKQSVNARLAYGSYENKEATLGMGGKLVGPVNYYVKRAGVIMATVAFPVIWHCKLK